MKSGCHRSITTAVAAAGIALLGVAAIPVGALAQGNNSQQGNQGNQPPSTATVRIGSPLPLPVQPAMIPFQAELCTQAGGASCRNKPTSVAVPADRLLVIEYASGRCPRAGFSLNVAQDWAAALETTAGGTKARHLLHPYIGISIGNQPLASAMSLNGFDVAQQTRIYADPGSMVVLDFEDIGGLGDKNISCEIAISGHTVAAQ